MDDVFAIEGGHVLTPEFDVIEANVLVDREAGEVIEVGPDVTAEETLDATDSLVMPGLVNAHTHVAMTLLRGYADDKPLDAWLQEDIWPVEAELTPEDIRVGTELGLVEFIKNGITGFADSYFEVGEIAAATEQSGLRANLCHAFISVGKDNEGARADAQEGLDIAREFDGAADGRITTALMPHSLTTVETEYLEEFIPQAREAGVPLHFHANETQNEVDPLVDDHGVRPLEYADDLGMLTDQDFLAHCVHVDETEIELLAETGASVIHCPASNMKLASGIAPIQEMLDTGVNVGLGTDGAASNNDLDLFDEIRDAAMIGKLARGDARDVAAESAVRMATEGSAEAIGLPVGQIEAGGTADIAVVDFDAPHLTPVHDFVSHLAYAVRGSDVRHTVCDGEILMADGEVQTLDEAAVKQRASEAAEALVDRAE
ncbi:5-methylthioadenosine/S-adenosylhomocysteine deaminase [Halohasta litchfieldiae]|jgi:5-methylthioadenosine/S-adenosylhomocysteine deaminase|uniref:5-methylthioadenosine/S-adenosylhomocysteine deaminase n=1 Tax=Halohasta litchfieldiae TaxID=1073996 RepID=A0A1H6R9M3_9EURY|nr:amidohydrolase [Halohasta litchfieldiae]ATW88481.1 5-methylthioadenosine/S-adenosylhomocysteine deaminase [Halohasta litchfieldiae]SEI49924.1 5-methylthioadenosine/S-adenosylhomocysteine deaminase [Halohasta litchfieldiae]